MALSTYAGGSAGKMGINYEALIGVYAMMDVLFDKAQYIHIEMCKDDGAEFLLKYDSHEEYWQVKRQITSQKTWSISSLADVLLYFYGKYKLNGSCVFASSSDAPELKQLIENAKAAHSLTEFENDFLSKGRHRAWNEIIDLLDCSQLDAFMFLKSIKIEGAHENTLEKLNILLLGQLFLGNSQTVFLALKDIYLQGSHEQFSKEKIEQKLKNIDSSIIRRTNHDDVKTRIAGITSNYLCGQKSKLIKHTLIRRDSANEIVSTIKTCDSSKDFIITSAAGGGKSACLYQIVSDLCNEGIAVLAFRLDRINQNNSEIVLSTKQLGEKIDLKESPVYSLAESYKNQPLVLVIDQLDAVSLVSGRRSEFFDVIATLREEVLAYRQYRIFHIIVACRKFDFDHDHRFKIFKNKDEPIISLENLSREDVQSILTMEGGDINLLSKGQQEMLQVPQNLLLFCEAKLVKAQSNFNTHKELCDAYWDEKRRCVANMQFDFDNHWMPAINLLVDHLNTNEELSAPKNIFDDIPTRFIDALVSEGVLSLDQKRYGFRHESFFDYCYARTLKNDGADFIMMLESGDQRLFRRSQLRQILTYLRDANISNYLKLFKSLLFSKKIRPHLQLSAVELLASNINVKNEELELLMPFISRQIDCHAKNINNSDKLCSCIWNAFLWSSGMFKAALQQGYIKTWIDSSNELLKDDMAKCFRWHSNHFSDEIAELLEPFIDHEDWENRLLMIMERGNVDSGRRFFDLFLRLLDKGVLDNARERLVSNGTFGTLIYGVANKKPDWFLELIAHWLDRRIKIVSTIETQEERIEAINILDEETLVKDLYDSANSQPSLFLQLIIPRVLKLAQMFVYDQSDNESFSRDAIWGFRCYNDDYYTLKDGLLGASEHAISILGSKTPQILESMMPQLKNANTYVANTLLLQTYLSAPTYFAEEAMLALISEPRRLKCGYSDNGLWIAQRLILNSSPHCQIETFKQLENLLLNYVPSWEREKKYISLRGNASFNLVSELDSQRLSGYAQKKLRELREKFKQIDEPPRGIIGCDVESPIPEEKVILMNDDQWLSAIVKYSSEKRCYNYKYLGRGGANELAILLEQQTKINTERFIRIALQFPPKTLPCYYAAIMRGISSKTVPVDVKNKILSKVIEIDDEQCIKNAIDLIESIPSHELSTLAIDYIKSCTQHANPLTKKIDNYKQRNHDDILIEGINSIRGKTARFIASVISKNRNFMNVFSTEITMLVSDPSMAVRSCVGDTLISVAEFDEYSAMEMYQTLIKDADDRLLASRYCCEFMYLGLCRHFLFFKPIMEMMMNSQHPSVKQAAGNLIAYSRLHHSDADELFEKGINLDENIRLGICEVLNRNFIVADCKEWCISILKRFFYDLSPNVQQLAARCFWIVWTKPNIPLTDYEELIKSFISSPAFLHDATYLLHALEDTHQKIPSITIDVCEYFISRQNDTAEDGLSNRTMAFRSVSKLVFTAYAQLDKMALQERVLNLIDALLLANIYDVQKYLQDYER